MMHTDSPIWRFLGSRRALVVCAVLAVVLLLWSVLAHAADPRFCGPPKRDAQGEIVRKASVRAAFVREHPCPVQAARGCPGGIVDHVIPLACGGCDAVENMQWLPRDLWMRKSAWGRKVYGGRGISKACP